MARPMQVLEIEIRFKFSWLEALKMRLAGVEVLQEYLRLQLENSVRDDAESEDNDAVQY